MDDPSSGPSIRHDMVQDQQQDVVFGVEGEERGPDHRAFRQIEGQPGLLENPSFRLALLRVRGKVREIYHLHRPAILRGEGGAQDMVSCNKRIQALMQRRQIQHAAQSEEHRNIVDGGSGVPAVQKPDPLLGERERGGVSALPWWNGSELTGCGAAAIEKRSGKGLSLLHDIALRSADIGSYHSSLLSSQT